MTEMPIPGLSLPDPSLPAAVAALPPRAPRSFARRHGALLALVLADACSKLLAFALLPHEETVTLLPGLRLHLAINEWGVMGGVKGLGPVAARPVYTMLLAAGLLVLALTVLRLAATRMTFGRRLAVGTLVFLGVAFVAEAGSAAFPSIAIPAETIVATIRFAALALALAFYAASRSPAPRAAFTLLAAGALANSASGLYPPFAVVDFLVVPLAPFASLAAMAGAAAHHGVAHGLAHALAMDEDTVGVINLADTYLFLFPLLLAAWPAAAALGRSRRRAGSAG